MNKLKNMTINNRKKIRIEHGLNEKLSIYLHKKKLTIFPRIMVYNIIQIRLISKQFGWSGKKLTDLTYYFFI
jgi:hypothetical protein